MNHNIFLLYMPPTNYEAQVHYVDTIKKGVPIERIARYLTAELREQLNRLFGNRPLTIWGSRDSPSNRRKFDQMAIRDNILIIEGETIKLLGIVAAKLISPDLSRELWRNLRGDDSAGWDLIYFIANPREINLPFQQFCRLFHYQENLQLRGFTLVSAARRDAFYEKYDDLYDVLIRLKQGEAIEAKKPDDVESYREAVARDVMSELTEDDVEEVLQSDLITDHVKMQWKLARLGMKAGVKVWVPLGDQTKIRRLYQYNEFESAFTTGIDLPTGYFENIDVVWKEQFRIDAAFEVENSTAIYSGLLRFADLNIVAPNTAYPLFIVSPAERRGQVRSQLCRPAFRYLKMDSKVRFLPYEVIDEVDNLFTNLSSGMNIEILEGKAERLPC